MKNYTIALMGNQNSGKTTLFNILTKSNQHIGNFPGITVEKKEGICEAKPYLHIIDLPGIYSLSTYSNDEEVATSFVIDQTPDLIINIVDATNIERNLYLTMQLLELDIPMVVVLNRMDVVINNRQTIDIQEITKQLGVPVIPISAQKKQGIDTLLQTLDNVLLSNGKIEKKYMYQNQTSTIEEVIKIIEPTIQFKSYPLLYCAIKVLEGDGDWTTKLELSQLQIAKITTIRRGIEKSTKTDIESYIIQLRYQIITNLCKKAVNHGGHNKSQILSDRIDAILMHKYIGIPIFLSIMMGIFYVTFNLLGVPLQNILDTLLQQGSDKIIALLSFYKVEPWLLSLVQDGILAGMRSVLSFLPIIVLLFFFLTLLEDSGYMARVAFIMDALLQKVGLTGKSFVPMILGFGCSVPAILATRTLPSNKDRKLTIILIPFISCSAKLPIYSLLVKTFFPNKAAITMLLMYSLGIFVAIIVALLLKGTIFVGESVPFLMELPTYRMPTLKNIRQQVSDKAKDFIKKAFTIIFIASIVIWFLQSYNLHFEYINTPNKSILAKIGYTIAWIFKPLGCGDWRLTTSLFTGIIAKESVVSTLAIVTKATNEGQLLQTMSNLLTPVSALAFLTFTVLYVPCVATIATIYKELRSLKETVLIVIFQTGVAYFVAYIIHWIGTILI